MPGVTVIVEHRDGTPRKVALEALSAGKKVAGTLGEELSAIVIGHNVAGLAAALGQYGAKKVYLLDNEAYKEYICEPYTSAIAECVENVSPSLVLTGATPMGRDLLPRLGARLGAGVAPDCTELDVVDGKIVATRPIYAGKAITKVEWRGSDVALASIRPNVLPVDPPDESATAEVVELSVSPSEKDLRARIREVLRVVSTRPELTEADIIVSGGRGMKGPEHYALLEELADVLGAAVGASRAAVDAGWREHQFQVGQTGKTVSPTLYIACGISGAIQHLAGMKTSKVIVAVNKDPEAPIFNVADYGIVGDLFKVVPIMTEEVKKLKAEG